MAAPQKHKFKQNNRDIKFFYKLHACSSILTVNVHKLHKEVLFYNNYVSCRIRQRAVITDNSTQIALGAFLQTPGSRRGIVVQMDVYFLSIALNHEWLVSRSAGRRTGMRGTYSGFFMCIICVI